ncbi:MAG: small multi-drug export protein [Proteobacteria bacterium]|nr:small multi-drug export protein [Desulfobacula sp.]MBU3954795.1 small multi-drug export protein [Pseudomonadota bacterium]MBU4131400.1 small multi-drug export protein [Pseudomonadota bacterium]
MKQTLFSTVEGKLLLIGTLLTLVLAICLIFFGFTDLETAKILFLVFITHILGSRAGGIGLCILNGFNPLTTIAYNFYVEVLIVCFTYSGFVLSTTNYLKIEWIKRFMDQLAIKALERKEKIRSYGWIGIFLFVMAPLPVTGPVVGSIIGYMLKLSLFRNFTASALGTLAANVAWCFGFEFLEQRFHMIQYIFGAIVIIVMIPYIKHIKKFIVDYRKSDVK